LQGAVRSQGGITIDVLSRRHVMISFMLSRILKRIIHTLLVLRFVSNKNIVLRPSTCQTLLICYLSVLNLT